MGGEGGEGKKTLLIETTRLSYWQRWEPHRSCQRQLLKLHGGVIMPTCISGWRVKTRSTESHPLSIMYFCTKQSKNCFNLRFLRTIEIPFHGLETTKRGAVWDWEQVGGFVVLIPGVQDARPSCHKRTKKRRKVAWLMIGDHLFRGCTCRSGCISSCRDVPRLQLSPTRQACRRRVSCANSLLF